MELIERIEQQMAATQLPLFAITLAAVPCPDTPVILTLHWHAFVRGGWLTSRAPIRSPTNRFPVPRCNSTALEDVLTVDRAASKAARTDARTWRAPSAIGHAPWGRIARSARVPAGVRCVSLWSRRQPSSGVGCARYRRPARRRSAPRLSHVDVPASARRHLEGRCRRCHASSRRHTRGALPS